MGWRRKIKCMLFAVLGVLMQGITEYQGPLLFSHCFCFPNGNVEAGRMVN